MTTAGTFAASAIQIAKTQAEISACMALRWKVFVEEQGVPAEDELDGTDVGAVHVIAMSQGQTVGVARFHVTDDSVKIGRVCVDPVARGHGLGAALIRFVLAQHADKTALLGAQTDAIAFYEKLGFAATGAPYMDAGIPHRDMERVP